MVCRLSLMIARAVNLSEEALQDLGLLSMFHDMGYAAREGADLKMDLKVLLHLSNVILLQVLD